MSDSKSEQVLQALFTLVSEVVPSDAQCLRNEPLPVRLPAGGLITQRDGAPGEPVVTMSPVEYEYDHQIELEIVVTATTSKKRDKKFDAILQTIGNGLSANRSLGGLVMYLEAKAPEPQDIPIEASTPIKAAVLSVIANYVTADPLL